MASVLIHVLVAVLLWPFAVPFGAIVGLLYRLYPISLIHVFRRYGSYLIPGLSIQTVSVRGIDISYCDRPSTSSDQPTLVFVHGFTSNKLSWFPMIKSLPKSWRIIALDLPGHGLSGFRENAGYNVTGMDKILHEFFEVLGLTQFHLVGESLGALYSTNYASTHPEMLSSLTLLCPPGAHRLEGGKSTKAMEILDRKGVEITKGNPLLPESADQFQEMLDLVLYRPDPFACHKGMLEAVVQVQKTHYEYFREILRDMVNTQETPDVIRSRTEGLPMPCLIIWGKHDKVCDVSGAKLMKKMVKNSRVYIVNNCGHALSMEKPFKCSKLLERFVTDQCSNPST